MDNTSQNLFQMQEAAKEFMRRAEVWKQAAKKYRRIAYKAAEYTVNADCMTCRILNRCKEWRRNRCILETFRQAKDTIENFMEAENEN